MNRCFVLFIAAAWAVQSPTIARADHSVLTAVRTLDEESNDDQATNAEKSADNPEVVTERHPDGSIRLQKQVTQDFAGNFQLNGYWRMFDQQGHLIIDGHMLNGRKEGHWTRIVDSRAQEELAPGLVGFEAPFMSEVSFQDGRMHGAWTLRDRRQRTVFTLIMKHDVRDGVCVWRHSNGELLREVNYREGILQGPYREWNERGELVRDEVFIDGRRQITQTDYFDGQPTAKKAERTYLSQRLQLKEQDDWWNTRLAQYALDGADVAHGVWTSWHVNEQMKMRVTYRWGERQGFATWWYENGQIEAQGNFRNDLEQGSWTWWHSNGSKKAEGQYDNGRPVQTWRAWRDDGRLQSKMEDPFRKLGRREYSVLRVVRAERDCWLTPMVAHYADPTPSAGALGVEDLPRTEFRWSDRRAAAPAASKFR